MSFDNTPTVSFHDDLTPAEYICHIFDRTDLDGIAYIPGWHYDRPGWVSDAPGSTDEHNSYRCRLNWSMRDRDCLLRDYKKLYGDLLVIADRMPDWDVPEETARQSLKEDGLVAVWRNYLRPLDAGSLDERTALDIYDRLDTAVWVRQLAGQLAEGHSLDAFEKGALIEYMDVEISAGEQAYYDQWLKNRGKDAQNRIGGELCACEVVSYARRLCTLMQLNAPEIMLRNEGRQLAAAMVLNRFGISRNLVDDRVRLEAERIDAMDDEELDRLMRPKKMNSRKSMAPLFVYQILLEQTDATHHLRQTEILRKLEEYPYEIFVERKTLGRIVHNLADSQLHIKVDKTGVWYEK